MFALYFKFLVRCDLCIGDAAGSSVSSKDGEKQFVGDCKWDATEYV
jgi:hypothetical protein